MRLTRLLIDVSTNTGRGYVEQTNTKILIEMVDVNPALQMSGYSVSEYKNAFAAVEELVQEQLPVN